MQIRKSPLQICVRQLNCTTRPKHNIGSLSWKRVFRDARLDALNNTTDSSSVIAISA